MVGFQFVEGVLDFPALGISQSQLLCGSVGGVEDRGQQPVLLGVVSAIVEGVVDHPNRQRRSVCTLGSRGGDDLRQPGAVLERFEMPR